MLKINKKFIINLGLLVKMIVTIYCEKKVTKIIYMLEMYKICYTYHITKTREKNMFRLWAKLFKDNRMLKDTVVCDDSQDTRTHKVFHAIDDVCYQFDLGKPIWLESTIQEFKRHDKARFDSFIEDIDFDYMEIQVIEED